MFRKWAGSMFVTIAIVGFGCADEFGATISAIDGNTITFQPFKNGKKDGGEITATVNGNAIIAKGVFDTTTKTHKTGDAVEGGLMNMYFTEKIKEVDGVNARVTTNRENNVTQILVIGKKKPSLPSGLPVKAQQNDPPKKKAVEPSPKQSQKWEYGELRQEGSIVWITAEGVVIVKDWEAMGDKLNAPALKKDALIDSSQYKTDAMKRYRVWNQLGEQGWEMFDHQNNEKTGLVYWMFKRRK